MSYKTSFNTDDYSDDTVEMIENRDRFYALLEKYPMFILPICISDDKDARKIRSFLHALFCLNGITVTSASGVYLSLSGYSENAGGPYKHSRMEPCDFLILTDTHGESDEALKRLVYLAAEECCAHFVAEIHGKGFKAAVDVDIPCDLCWVPSCSASLVNMIIQSRCLASPCAKLDLPFVIESVYETTEMEKKFYKLTGDTPLTAWDRGNHQYTHWKNFPVYE